MDNRMLSVLVGIFSILNTIQLLIFDLNELTLLGYEDKFSIYVDSKSGLTSWILIHKKSISICLSTITVMASTLLLYSIHASICAGLLSYALWIVLYELINFSMVLLINRALKYQFREIGYPHLFFQVSLMLLYFFSLPFIVKYTYNIYMDPKTLSKISRRRLSSITTLDSWTHVGPAMMYRKLN
ncbi:PREDICTED: transmembrane protein 217-like [Miniopterus natalensis]|uniref:transmembrane protein 217-like n=1 Tax=Miniopterus natalensis TaxID=291302 RepID=UPI0007A6E8E6|nr:PREDICTED: transmembrane protein 217-like [Miniopterus natalensis]